MVVGITGGIATGKTTVTHMLKDRGAVTFSADEAGRAVLIRNGTIVRQISQEFGAGAVTPGGEIDRAFLARLVFSDPEAREKLNRIVHPPIRRLLAAQIRAAQDDFSSGKVIAVEIPLLYEGNLQSWFERIVVVSASVTAQAMRLMSWRGIDARGAQERIEAQLPIARKAAAANYIVENNGSEADLTPQVDDLWRKLNNS